jgi:hypothetical protein|tara:strand:- start:7214 stop:7387 length:174 start_codon:yes stop_codon:yes gene_type:complete
LLQSFFIGWVTFGITLHKGENNKMTDQQIIQQIWEGNPRKGLENIYTFSPKVSGYIQ